MASAFAAVTVHNDVYEAYYDSSRTFITTNTPLDGAQAIGYVCADADCSQVGQALWNAAPVSSSANRITLLYPTTKQFSGSNGYGVYVFKEGYIPWEIQATWSGTGTAPTSFAAYLSKINECRSTIDSFEVVNDAYPNQPLWVNLSASLNSRAYAAIQSSGPLEYVPSSLQDHYTVDTRITVEIVSEQGVVVNTQFVDVKIPFSESVPISFQWVPSVLGRYTARVSTQVLDSVCIESEAQFSQKDFNVISRGPSSACYSLLQDLQIRPIAPVANQSVTLTVKRLANFYDTFGNLRPLAHSLVWTVLKDGQVVHESKQEYAAQADVQTFATSQFSYTPLTQGYYTFSVKGETSLCPFNEKTEDVNTIGILVNGPTPLPQNKAPVWVTLPSEQVVMNSGQNVLYAPKNFVSDPDGDTLQVTIKSSSAKATCILNAQGFLTCTPSEIGCGTITFSATDGKETIDASAQLCVVRENQAPVLQALPSQTLDANKAYPSLLNVATFASDPDADALIYSISYQSNTNAVTCSFTSSVLSCQTKDPGVSELTIRVTDGLHVASQVLYITVQGATATLSAQFPDVQLFENSGLNQNIFRLSQKVTNPANLPLIFSIIGETRTDIVDCFINGDMFDCDVKQGASGSSTVTIRADGQQVATTDTLVVSLITNPNGAQCGPAARNYAATETQYTQSLCTRGSPQLVAFPTPGSSVTYFCATQTSNITCGATRDQVVRDDGVCGTAAKNYATTDTQLQGTICASGTLVGQATMPAIGATSFWSCSGSNGGGTAVCSAYRAQAPTPPGVCGSASKDYEATQVSFTGSFCQSGTLASAPTFPQPGTNVQWTCSGSPSVICGASRQDNTPVVNAVCGQAATVYPATTLAFSGNFCQAGTVAQVPLFPNQGGQVQWTCVGSNGGSSTFCTASRSSAPMSVNGVCGTATRNYLASETQLLGTFCQSGDFMGTPMFPQPGGSYTWTCNGQNGGVTASCTATRDTIPAVPGLCGSATRAYTSDETSFGSGVFCSSGQLSSTPTFPLEGQSATWTCLGTNAPNQVCVAFRQQAPQPPINGACGTAARVYSPTDTSLSGSFCQVGSVVGSPFFPSSGSSSSWTCSGQNGGTNAVCVASRTAPAPVDGECGTASRIYGYEDTALTGTFCSVGTRVGVPVFPAPLGQSQWTCAGSNGGANAICAASRAGPPTPVNGVCGNAAQAYPNSAITFIGAFCSSGSTASTPLFPLEGESATWTCVGSNGGVSSVCLAYHAPQITATLAIPDVTLVKNQGDLALGSLDTFLSPQVPGLVYTLMQVSDGHASANCRIESGSMLICGTNTNRIGSTTFEVIARLNGVRITSDRFTVVVNDDGYHLNTTRSQTPDTDRLSVTRFQVGTPVAKMGDVPISIRLTNSGSSIDSAKVSFIVPELGIMNTIGPFRIGAGQSVDRTVMLQMEDAQPGIYDLRLTMSSNGQSVKVVHREIIVD
jgi:hypothetical protein